MIDGRNGADKKQFRTATLDMRARLEMGQAIFTFLSIVCVVFCALEIWFFVIVMRTFNFLCKQTRAADSTPIVGCSTTASHV